MAPALLHRGLSAWLLATALLLCSMSILTGAMPTLLHGAASLQRAQPQRHTYFIPAEQLIAIFHLLIGEILLFL
jgi:hypothetical protein